MMKLMAMFAVKKTVGISPNASAWIGVEERLKINQRMIKMRQDRTQVTLDTRICWLAYGTPRFS